MIKTTTEGLPVNDDDLYIVDLARGTVGRRIGSRRDFPHGLPDLALAENQRLAYGIRAKYLRAPTVA